MIPVTCRSRSGKLAEAYGITLRVRGVDERVPPVVPDIEPVDDAFPIHIDWIGDSRGPGAGIRAAPTSRTVPHSTANLKVVVFILMLICSLPGRSRRSRLRAALGGAGGEPSRSHAAHADGTTTPGIVNFDRDGAFAKHTPPVYCIGRAHS